MEDALFLIRVIQIIYKSVTFSADLGINIIYHNILFITKLNTIFRYDALKY